MLLYLCIHTKVPNVPVIMNMKNPWGENKFVVISKVAMLEAVILSGTAP